MLLNYAQGVRPNLRIPPSQQAFEFYLRTFFDLEINFDWTSVAFDFAATTEKLPLARLLVLLPTTVSPDTLPSVWQKYWDNFVHSSQKVQQILLGIDPAAGKTFLTELLGPEDLWPPSIRTLAQNPVPSQGEFSYFTYYALAQKWLRELLELRSAFAEAEQKTDRLEIFIFKLIESVGFFRHVRPDDLAHPWPGRQYLLYQQAQKTAAEFVGTVLPELQDRPLQDLAKMWQHHFHFPVFPQKKLGPWRTAILRPLGPEEAYFAYLAGMAKFKENNWPQGAVPHRPNGEKAALDPAAQFLMLTDENGHSRGILKFFIGTALKAESTAKNKKRYSVAVLDQVHLIKGEEFLTVLLAARKAWQNYGYTLVISENFMNDQGLGSFALRKILKAYLKNFVWPKVWVNFAPMERDIASDYKDERLDDYGGQNLWTLPGEEVGDFVFASTEKDYFMVQDKFPVRKQDFGRILNMPNSSTDRDWKSYIANLRRFAWAYPFRRLNELGFITDIVRRPDLSFDVRFRMLRAFYPELQNYYLLLGMTIFADPEEQLAILRDLIGQKSVGFFMAQNWQKYYQRTNPHGPDDPAKILGLLLSKIRYLDVKLDEVFWRDFVDGLTVADSKIFDRGELIKTLLALTEMQDQTHEDLMESIQRVLMTYIH